MIHLRSQALPRLPAPPVVYDHAISRLATHVVGVLLALALLAGCGGAGTAPQGTTRPAATAPAAALPALATRAATSGEIVVRGDASPLTRGPYAFDGRYLVRFEQYAPEDPALDFTAQTPLSAALAPRRDDPRGAIRLVEDAARSGRRELAIHGRYFVSVEFGDFPFVIRFTPRRG